MAMPNVIKASLPADFKGKFNPDTEYKPLYDKKAAAQLKETPELSKSQKAAAAIREAFNSYNDYFNQRNGSSVGQRASRYVPSLFNYLAQRYNNQISPTHGYEQAVAAMLDSQAAKADVIAQKNAQIANRDYKKEAEKKAVASAHIKNAIANRTDANKTGGAVGLAAQTVDADYNTEMARADAARQQALEAQKYADTKRIDAGDLRADSAGGSYEFADRQLYNNAERDLSYAEGGDEAQPEESYAKNPAEFKMDTTPESVEDALPTPKSMPVGLKKDDAYTQSLKGYLTERYKNGAYNKPDEEPAEEPTGIPYANAGSPYQVKTPSEVIAGIAGKFSQGPYDYNNTKPGSLGNIGSDFAADNINARDLLALNTHVSNKEDEEEEYTPSDANCKDVYYTPEMLDGIISDVNQKLLQGILSKGEGIDADDYNTLSAIYRYENRNNDLSKFDGNDWSDDMVQEYANNLKNFLYTYKPEARNIDPSIDPQEPHRGPMAQDIEKVAPDCVKETPDGTKVVDGDRLALVNAGVLGEMARRLIEVEKLLGVNNG